jgi:hypothetical protein
MNMLKPIPIRAPQGRIPEGMKIVTMAGPNTLQPLPINLALAVGGFTLWPMSYIDNRVSFGMVMYDLKWQVIGTVEKPGARYIYKITLDGSDAIGNATFWGQADQKVTMSLDEICRML